MNTQFDEIVNRCGSGALKVDMLKEKFGREDLLPLWVADMDFKTPEVAHEALVKALSHPIYGYSGASAGYWNSILQWERDTNGLLLKREEVAFVPGIVRGISYVIQCFSRPGDKIVVQPPVYMPFISIPKGNERKLLFNQLVFRGGTYDMDLDGLEELCRTQKPAIFILCNPHNPAGRVWDVKTLSRVAEICAENNVLVISDEIHGDMPLFGHSYTPFTKVSQTAADICIEFKAPSKTFNIAGLMSSYCIVKNPQLRSIFFSYLESNEFDFPLYLATVATEAVYTKARAWRTDMLEYVEENVRFVDQYLKDNIPGVTAVIPQASFLIWLNCSGLGLNHDALIDLFVNKAHLALNDGEDFGPGGEGFMRLNVGTPKANVKEALDRLKNAINDLKNGK